MLKFYCEDCHKEFNTGSTIKKEYKDYLLGICSRNVALCPNCGKESGEKIIPKPLRAEKPENYCDGNCGHCHA